MLTRDSSDTNQPNTRLQNDDRLLLLPRADAGADADAAAAAAE